MNEIRRDLPPHRGTTLYWLSVFGVSLAILFLLVPIIGLAVNWVLLFVIRRDIAAMEAGQLDASGMPQMIKAKENAWLGRFVSAVALCPVAVWLLFEILILCGY